MASETSMIRAIVGKVKGVPGIACKKIHSGAMNRDIDLLVTVWGLACFFEIKVKGQKPTQWQYNRLAFWAASGAYTAWFDDVATCVDYVLTRYAAGYSQYDIDTNVSKVAYWQQLSSEATK